MAPQIKVVVTKTTWSTIPGTQMVGEDQLLQADLWPSHRCCGPHIINSNTFKRYFYWELHTVYFDQLQHPQTPPQTYCLHPTSLPNQFQALFAFKTLEFNLSCSATLEVGPDPACGGPSRDHMFKETQPFPSSYQMALAPELVDRSCPHPAYFHARILSNLSLHNPVHVSEFMCQLSCWV